MLVLLPLFMDKRWVLMPKCCDNSILGFPSLGILWTSAGGGATKPNSFQPGGYSIFYSFFVWILHIHRWTQRLRWPQRTRRCRTQRRLKLRYQNGLLLKEGRPMFLTFFRGTELFLHLTIGWLPIIHSSRSDVKNNKIQSAKTIKSIVQRKI